MKLGFHVLNGFDRASHLDTSFSTGRTRRYSQEERRFSACSNNQSLQLLQNGSAKRLDLPEGRSHRRQCGGFHDSAIGAPLQARSEGPSQPSGGWGHSPRRTHRAPGQSKGPLLVRKRSFYFLRLPLPFPFPLPDDSLLFFGSKAGLSLVGIVALVFF